MSPVLSAQLFLCQWQREATDGWCGVAQCGLIINSVLCCRGALNGSCLTSVGLNWCLSSFSFSFFKTYTSLHRLCLLISSLSSLSPAPPTLPQRCTSGVIMDHVNASEATRLESHCCSAHGQLLPPPKSYRHSCDAGLSFPLDVTLREKKRKMKRSEREKEDPRRACAYFGYSATIKMRHPLAQEFTSGEKLLLMCL